MKLAFIITLLFSLSLVWAQEPYALHLDKKSGLPSQSVYQIHQDKLGFFWLASDVGLTRYDGFRFETYYSEDQTSFSGSCIQEDQYGRIWYENFDGFLYFADIKKEKLVALGDKNSLGYLPYGITSKYLFHTTSEGVCVYDLKTLDKIELFKIKILDAQHTGNTGESFFFIEKERLYAFDKQLKKRSIKIDFIKDEPRQIYPIDENRILLCSKYNKSEQIYVLNANLDIVDSFAIPEVRLIHSIYQIDNKLWICSPGGVYIFDYEGNLVNHFFPNLSVSCVFKDAQDNYWFSTTNQGIYIVPKLGNKFLFGKDRLPNKIVKFKNETYLISTKKGEIFHVNKSFEILKTVVNNPKLGEVFQLHYDEKQDVISYTANKFYQLNGQDFSVIRELPFSVKEVVPIDHRYTAFAASNVSGLFLTNKTASSSWSAHFPKEDEFNIIEIFINQRSRSVAYDSIAKVIYFATNNGLFVVSKNKTQEIKLDEQSVFASKLVIFDNKLYVLSTKGNLYTLNSSQHLELLNPRLDVSTYDVRFIRQFKHKLIVATSSYIYEIVEKSNRISTYNLNVSEYEINDILLDGEVLYLVINQGVIKTSLDLLDHAEIQPRMHINKLITPETEFKPDVDITLSHNNNEVKIEYSILDFGKSIPTTLFYRINESQWVKTSSLSRDLTFPKLEAGQYKIDFKFKDGQLLDSVVFTIRKPWWRQLWFISFIILSISSLVYGYYRYRVNILSVKNKLLEENVQLEKNLRHSLLTTINPTCS